MSTYSFSSTLTNALLNVLNGTAIATNAYTTSGNVFVALHTAAPGTAGTTSASVGNATRQSATFGTSSAGVISITGTPAWTNGGTSETLTAVSFWSASSAGTYLGCAQLTSSQAWASGNVYTLSALSYTVPTAA
jgi:hypothetical protein